MTQKFSLLLLAALAVFFVTDVNAQAKPAVKKAPVRTTTKPAAKPVVKKPATSTTAKAIPVVVKDKSIRVKITTDSGVIVVKLSDSTPLHRDNFVKLVKQGFYDSLLFHRVIAGFMIQGGDPQSKYAQPNMMLGNGGGDMARIPAEFNNSLIHKKGALAAARDGNPEKASSACQFYLVEGTIISDADLDAMEARQNRKYTPEQRALYKTIGGTPFLDTQYTVFGEVISGLDVISKIANVPKDGANRPFGDVRMKMELVK